MKTLWLKNKDKQKNNSTKTQHGKVISLSHESHQNLLFLCIIKSTKILNYKKNSKRKVPYQMVKSKAQTHQTNG